MAIGKKGVWQGGGGVGGNYIGDVVYQKNGNKSIKPVNCVAGTWVWPWGVEKGVWQ